MLGLDRPAANQPTLNQSNVSRSNSNQTGIQPNMDLLRDKSFSGLDSFLEPEQTNTGARRIAILLVLLAALGGAGWWTYTNYLGVAVEPKSATAVSNPNGTSPENPPILAPQTKAAVPSSLPAATPAASRSQVPESSAETTNPETSVAGAGANSSDAAGTKSPIASPATAKAPHDDTVRSASKREPEKALAQPARSPATAADTGDAAFRKGEAYLYGRGVHENCDEAVKNLKTASAKSNARARSAFGTMYATGHCVPRDLPRSYYWFALALRADPNNRILEKDLSAVWAQMTPPERQLATRIKE